MSDTVEHSRVTCASSLPAGMVISSPYAAGSCLVRASGASAARAATARPALRLAVAASAAAGSCSFAEVLSGELPLGMKVIAALAAKKRDVMAPAAVMPSRAATSSPAWDSNRQ